MRYGRLSLNCRDYSSQLINLDIPILLQILCTLFDVSRLPIH